MAWVVRAGEAKARDLISGYADHRAVAGLYGFSVQYAPGAGRGASDQLGDKATLDDLALSGRFPHAIISYEDEAVLAAALEAVGYRMRLVASPGVGHHHTFCVVEDLSGAPQTTLPSVVADALAQTFHRMPNPHRIAGHERRRS